jgi:predicted TIM-barrel fold metal-dependent hydrolase
MAQLIRYADRMGIDRLVLSLGVPLVENPTPEQVRDTNNQVLEVLRQWPERAVGLVYLNPNYPDFCLEEFDRCVRDGPMVGIKLWVAKRCDTPDLDPLMERAASLGAIVFQHTWLKAGGNQPGESTPFDVAALAGRHPRTSIICGHTGGDWERGIRVIRSLPNVPIGIAGSDPTAGFIEMAVRELGAERVLYGSDVPGRSFASQLSKVLGAEIPIEAKRLIAGGNLRRLLGPILKAKGIPI